MVRLAESFAKPQPRAYHHGCTRILPNNCFLILILMTDIIYFVISLCWFLVIFRVRGRRPLSSLNQSWLSQPNSFLSWGTWWYSGVILSRKNVTQIGTPNNLDRKWWFFAEISWIQFQPVLLSRVQQKSTTHHRPIIPKSAENVQFYRKYVTDCDKSIVSSRCSSGDAPKKEHHRKTLASSDSSNEAPVLVVY